MIRATFYVLLCGTVALLCYYQVFQSFGDSRRLKNILLWNGYERLEMSTFGTGHQPFIDSCSVSDCFVTSDPSSMNFGDFDAVVFNIPVLGALPPAQWRQRHQRFVFFSQESPFYNNLDVNAFAGYFNWTMSFQHHSDIPFPYGSVEAKSTNQQNAFDANLSARKTKLVAAFVSHCHTQSRRESYMAELGKFVPVDTFGLCGTLNCSRQPGSSVSSVQCYRMVEQRYKFFLAFENSLCVDYVTEKLFSVLQYQIVPVVMGAANYSSIAPPHSFIDALRFTPKKLADYLKLLDANLTLYNEFFQWKRRFTVRADQMAHRAFCSLCARLHQDDAVRIHDDLRPLWSPQTQCHRPFHTKVLAVLDRFDNAAN